MAMVVFNADNVYLYNKQFPYDRYPRPADVLLPGLKVCFDARSINKYKGVSYQAVTVLAGTWPAMPHPTMFPGGPGSKAPTYDVPEGHSFYYLDTTMQWHMDRQLREFSERAAVSTELLPTAQTVDSPQEFQAWKEYYAPMKFQRPRPYDKK